MSACHAYGFLTESLYSIHPKVVISAKGYLAQIKEIMIFTLGKKNELHLSLAKNTHVHDAKEYEDKRLGK